MHWAKGGQSARPGDGSGPMRRLVACPHSSSKDTGSEQLGDLGMVARDLAELWGVPSGRS